ncbi:hypothetical protein [Pseudoalteromonas sp. S2755]|uniref:hypothetical protein n=1 Tax=Pseudoalteromonas sp. S2755 TaxID=2066523 RepID=UPI00110A8EE2|nr:hypothetical protein [Pseudoalteromonas sp. S2755]TMN35351.1 hypothetical protein CWC03_15525 [Pseudoalteromonas sp. S2755]
MKYLLALLLLSTSLAKAAEPIMVFGAKYSYTKLDFEPKTNTATGQITGYTATIGMLLDEYDEFIGDYPILTFDFSAEVSSDSVPFPLPISIKAHCQNDAGDKELIGNSQGILIERFGRVLPARMNIFNRMKTNGACKHVNVDIEPLAGQVNNLDTVMKGIRFDALILSDQI